MNLFRIVCALSLVAICVGCVSSNAFAAPQGNDGTAGVNGDPGTNGTDGQDGEDVTRDDSPWPAIYAYAGDGGNGGRGGDGVDGDDADSEAQGGNGGHGGRGGNALADARGENLLGAFSRGGNGGYGGVGGRGTSLALDGMGGHGGNGGDARSELRSEAFSYYQRAEIGAAGGHGGGATGAGARAGHGGRASASFQNIGRSFQMYARLYGGNGGDAQHGAIGGNGASTFFGFSPEDYRVEGESVFRKQVQLRLGGGRGGNAINGTAGRAGTARVDLGVIVANHNLHAAQGSDGGFNTRVTIRGGAGGRGTAQGSRLVSGQRGAVGLVKAADATIERGMSLNVYINGGQGGSALGRNNLGDGGHGAAAIFDGQAKLDNRFNHNGSGRNEWTNFTLELRGGIGGHAQGSGRSGNGASVQAIDPVTIKNPNYVQTIVKGFGGDGGWGRFNGNGGNAHVEMNQIADGVPDRANPGQLSFTASATGGHAGRGVLAANGANGGDATVMVDQRSNRNVSIVAEALGGAGNQGRGGDAYADVVGHALATPGMFPSAQRRTAYLRVHAKATPFSATTNRSAYGSNAYASGEAVAESQENNGHAYADVKAFGGWGFLQSGSGEAVAKAFNQDGLAIANAGSLALGDRDRESDNYSMASAYGRSNMNAHVAAHAASSGLTSRTVAMTDSEAQNSNSSSLVTSQTTNWRHDVAVKSTASFEAQEGTTAQVTTGSSFSFRGDAFHASNGDVSSDLILVPDQAFADSFVTSNSTLGSIFVDDSQADILGVGLMSGGIGDANAEGVLKTRTEFDFDLQVREFHNDENLILGLFETGSSGDGFSEMSLEIAYNDRTIFDRTFDDLTDANAFFDSRWFDLREMPVERDFVSFDIIWTTTIENPEDSYEFGFVFGNASAPAPAFARFNSVPEPSSAILLVLTLAGCSIRRRRSV